MKKITRRLNGRVYIGMFFSYTVIKDVRENETLVECFNINKECKKHKYIGEHMVPNDYLLAAINEGRLEKACDPNSRGTRQSVIPLEPVLYEKAVAGWR